MKKCTQKEDKSIQPWLSIKTMKKSKYINAKITLS